MSQGQLLQLLARRARVDAEETAFARLYATANEVFSVASAFDMKELAAKLARMSPHRWRWEDPERGQD